MDHTKTGRSPVLVWKVHKSTKVPDIPVTLRWAYDPKYKTPVQEVMDSIEMRKEGQSLLHDAYLEESSIDYLP